MMARSLLASLAGLFARFLLISYLGWLIAVDIRGGRRACVSGGRNGNRGIETSAHGRTARSGCQDRFHEAAPMEKSHLAETEPLALPEIVPGQAYEVLVLDLQAKLNGPRSARIRDSAEATGEWSRTPRNTGRNKRRLQTRTENVAGRRVNVPIEHIEERGTEIDYGLLAKEARFLP